MEFSKLKKGISKFNKKGIKIAAFMLALSMMLSAIFAFRSGSEVEAASFSLLDANTLSYGSDTYN